MLVRRLLTPLDTAHAATQLATKDVEAAGGVLEQEGLGMNQKLNGRVGGSTNWAALPGLKVVMGWKGCVSQVSGRLSSGSEKVN